MYHLGPNRNRYWKVVDIVWASHSSFIPSPVLKHLNNRVLPCNEQCAVPVHRKYEIIILQSHRSSNLACFLPFELDVSSEPSLPLHVEGFLVKSPYKDKHLINILDFLFRKLGPQCLITVAVLIQHMQILY